MTAQEYNDVYSEPHHHELQIKVVNSSPEVVFTNSDICYESLTLDDSLFSDHNLRIGACESRHFSIKVVSEESLVGEWIDLYIYTDMPDILIDSDGNKIVDSDGDNIALSDAGANPAYTRIGRFKVFSDNRTNDRRWRELVCYDAMYDILNADMSTWYSGLTFPMTISSLRNSFFTYLNITQETVTLPNDSLQIQGGFDVDGGLSGKTVIEAICELNGCFGHITKDGTFKYVLFDTYTEVALDHYIDGTGTYEDYVVDNIDGVIARSAEDDVGTPSATGTMTHPYIINDNPLTYGLEGSDALKTALYNVYTSLRRLMIYRPYKVKTYGNPFLEVGTKITIETRDQTIESFVFCKTMTGIQALRDTISATGDKTLPNKVNALLSQIKRIKGKTHILENTVDTLKSEITSMERGNGRIYEVNSQGLSEGVYVFQVNILDDTFKDLATGEEITLGIIPYDNETSSSNKQLKILYSTESGNVTIDAPIYYGTSRLTNQVSIYSGQILYLTLSKDANSNYTCKVVTDTTSTSLIEQTADEIKLEVSEVAQLTLPIVPITTWSANVSNNTVTFEITNEDELEHIDLVHGTFKFAIKGINLSDLNMSRTKRIKITKGTTVITATIKNIDGSDVTSEIIKDCVINIEYGSRTINGVVYSNYFWIIPDSYSQAQINITNDQIVLKVDSQTGDIVEVKLGLEADDPSASVFQVTADNISFIANNKIELTTNNLQIDSTNFKVDSSGNVESKNFIVKTSSGSSGAFKIIDADDTVLGSWGTGGYITVTTYSSSSQTVSYLTRYCDFRCNTLYESSSLGDFDEKVSFNQDGFKLKLLVDPFASSASDRTDELKIVGYNYNSKKYIDIINSSKWGDGFSNSLRSTIATMFITKLYSRTVSIAANSATELLCSFGDLDILPDYVDFMGVAGFAASANMIALSGYAETTISGEKYAKIVITNNSSSTINDATILMKLLFVIKGAHYTSS